MSLGGGRVNAARPGGRLIMIAVGLVGRLIAPVDTMGCDQAGDDLPEIKPLTEKVSWERSD